MVSVFAEIGTDGRVYMLFERSEPYVFLLLRSM